MGATMHHTLDTSLWSTALDRATAHARDCTTPNREAGELLVGVVRRNHIDQGGPNDWPELSDATLLARARGRSGRGQVFYKRRKASDGTRAVTFRAKALILGAKALIWSSRLMRSVTYLARSEYVDVGSNLVQAARLWFGSRAGVKPPTPARNPFGRTSEDNELIRRIYARWFFGPLTGGG